ncbi:DUF998 domain-containing protein [Isoptericola halotolerans]|uniref:DUF998 domain-containing protein n=1 Tax=Isoptericola halotolerans TaxID=300560 RepID=UPI00388E6684
MALQKTEPGRIRPRAAKLSITCAVAAVLLMAFAQITQPAVAPSWQPPSELALGATGWAMTAGFALLGLACLLLFAALRGQSASRTARTGRWALLLAAAGGVLGAAFPTDRWDAAEPTTVGMVHNVAPVLLDAVLVAAVLLGISLVRRSEGWRPVRWWLRAGAVLVVGAAVILSVSMGLLMPPGSGLGPEVAIGWQARGLLVADAAWVAITAGCSLAVLRASRAAVHVPESADRAHHRTGAA